MTDDAIRENLERRLVWMLGSPRSGSTWLLRLIVHPWGVGHAETVIDESRFRPRGPDVVPINESYLAHHLALLRDLQPEPGSESAPLLVNDLRRAHPSYIFSDAYRESWQPAVRELALRRFAAQRDRAVAEHGLGDDPLVIIKEPNGSHGSAYLAELLPRSRILFLLRDGRDVIDSMIEADSPGGWRTRVEGVEPLQSEAQRLAAVRKQAQLWLGRTIATERACAMLPADQSLTVGYEDLLADTFGELKRIDAWLGIGRSDAAIRSAVRRHRFGSLRNRLRGPRMGVRAASPGLWRENLSRAEQEAMEELLGPKLRDLGYSA